MTGTHFEFSLVLFLSFVALLVRVGGLMVFAPFLASLSIPTRVRVALAVTISLALFPLLQNKIPTLPVDMVSVILVLFHELMIGLLLGFVGHLLLAAFFMAGQIMGFSMGFSLIRLIDPQTQVESSALALFENLVGVTVFLSMNAHHWFIQALVESYDLIVPFTMNQPGALATQLISLFGQVFVVGFKLAAPVTLVLVIVDVLFGVIGRAAPQVQILIIGMPLKPLIGFVLLAGTVQAQILFSTRYISQLRELLHVFLQMIR